MYNSVEMDGFLAIVFVAALGLLATSAPMQRWRRSRSIAVLLSGGWLWVGLGVVIGPYALTAIDQDLLILMTPLIAYALGWVGLMIGLQAERRVLSALPRMTQKTSLLDLVMTLVLTGAVSFACLQWWLDSTDGIVVLLLTGFLIASNLGWSMETRSLQPSPDAAEIRLAMLIRSCGGLAAILSLASWGLFWVFMTTSQSNGSGMDLLKGSQQLLTAVVLAVVLAVLTRSALRIAGTRPEDTLTVFIGVVVLLAGISVNLDVPPLFTALITGMVLANMGGVELRRFERFLLQAEHVIAVILALLAGMMLSPTIGLAGLILAVGLGATRIVFKPATLVLAQHGGRAATKPQSYSILHASVVRQSPVAIALGVSLVLEAPSPLTRQLLSAVILAGLCSVLLPFLIAIQHRESPMVSAPAPEVDSDSSTATDETDAHSAPTDDGAGAHNDATRDEKQEGQQ